MSLLKLPQEEGEEEEKEKEKEKGGREVELIGVCGGVTISF